MPIVKRNTFFASTKVKSSEVNTNFDDIITAFNSHTHTNTGTDAPLITASGIAFGGTLNAKTFNNPIKFSVFRAAAATSSNTQTLVPFDSKSFDTSSNVDVVTNKGRFTAPIPGFYFFTASVGNVSAGSTAFQAYLYKNGSSAKVGEYPGNGTVNGNQSVVSGFLQLAAGDFVEVYYVGGAGSAYSVGASNCYYDGFLVSSI